MFGQERQAIRLSEGRSAGYGGSRLPAAGPARVLDSVGPEGEEYVLTDRTTPRSDGEDAATTKTTDRPRRRRRGGRRRSSSRAPRDTGPVDDSPAGVAARRLGIRKLHPEQERVVTAVTEGRDVLMVLPTGFGKSACYQVPSMLLPNPTLVVSPLLALLKDQYDSMIELGVPCVRLDGSVRGTKRREAMERIEEGGPLLVMTTPETLATRPVTELLAKVGVSLMAIDEAHCISEWGHDFRPAYQRLGGQARKLGSPPILALTATATPRVRETIVESLGMTKPEVIAASPHRSNLAFEVLRCEGDMRPRALLRLIQRLRRPGIVYCATRRDVDEIYALLRRFGIPAHHYHGGMTAKERNEEQVRFMRPRTRTIMVATSAFGLGIDKPDIRYVLHYQAPAALEQYVQEAGRAGRDGRKSNCILLADVEPDRKIHEALLSRSRLRPEQLYRLGAALAAWSGEGRDPSLEALALSAELGPRIAAGLLATLEEAGLVERVDKEVRIVGKQETIEEDTRKLAGRFETLKTQDGRRLDFIGDYTGSDECRAVFLRRYFGEDDEGTCGLCDLCRGRTERPESFFEPMTRPQKKRGKKRRPRRRGGSRSAASASDESSDGKKKKKSGSRKSSRSRGRRGGRGRGRRRGGRGESGGSDGGGDAPTPSPSSDS